MMNCCEDCGAGDEVENMFFVRGDDGESKCVCFGCSQKYGLNCTPTEEIANALGGKQNRMETTARVTVS